MQFIFFESKSMFFIVSVTSNQFSVLTINILSKMFHPKFTVFVYLHNRVFTVKSETVNWICMCNIFMTLSIAALWQVNHRLGIYKDAPGVPL